MKIKPFKTGRGVLNSGRKAARFIAPDLHNLHEYLAKRPYAFLMRRYAWVRRWHGWRWHKHVHFAALFIYLSVIMLFVAANTRPLLAADVIDTWTFDSAGDYDIDSGAEVTGTAARLKAQEYASDGNTAGLWHLNEASGSTADDASSNNNDGTVTGGTFGTGNLNNGLTLNGTSDQISVPDSSSLSLSGQNSLEAWIKPDATISAGSSTQRQAILDKGDYQLYIDNETGKLAYEFADANSSQWTQSAGGINGSWELAGQNAVQKTTIMGTDVYVGVGASTGSAEVWKWNGTTWTKIGGDGINNGWQDSTFESVYGLTNDGTNIYAGLGASNGDGDVWKWNGITWTKIGGDGVNSGWAASSFHLSVLEWHSSKLYAGLGNGTNLGQVWEFNGTDDWTQIAGNGASTGNWPNGKEQVMCLESLNGKLYAGLGNTPGGDAELWEYSGTGTNWTQIAGDTINSSWDSSTFESVRSVEYHNSNLYVGIGDTNGDGEVWEFNGTNDWTQIGGDNLNSGWPATDKDAVMSLASDGTNLYAGTGTASQDAEIWMWNGSIWSKIGGDGLNSGWSIAPDQVGDLEFANGTIYATAVDASGPGYIMSWNGSAWTIFGGNYINASWGVYNIGAVHSMHVSGEYLYAGTGGGVGTANVWRSDGTTWTRIGGQGLNGSWAPELSFAVTSMASHNGKLYVGLGGDSATPGEVWEWNGSSWTVVGGDVNSSWSTATISDIGALVSFNGKLYASNGLGSSEGDLWEWNGSNDWTQIAGDSVQGSWNTHRRVQATAVYDNKLIVGIGNQAGQAEVWQWNGSNAWELIGGDDTNSSWDSVTYESVESMTVYNGKLYAGIGSSVGEAEVWEFNGTNDWTQVGGDELNTSWDSDTYEQVRSMVVYNGSLYAGLANSTGDGEVWRYNGTAWAKVGGDGLNGSWSSAMEGIESFSIYKGKLYAGTGYTGQADATVWTYGNNAYLSSDVSSFDTNWHHVAASYDGNTMRLFVDGVANGTRSVVQALPDGSKPLLIGASYGTREMGKPQARFDGQIDEVRISSTARSSFTSKPYSESPQAVALADAVNLTGIEAWVGWTANETANGGTITYRLSDDDGTTWKYWNGSAWVASSSYSQANPAATVNTNIATFPVTFYGIKWQAILDGDGTQRVTLNSLDLASDIDTTDPSANASSITAATSNGGTAISSNAWTNDGTPYYAWTAATDAESTIYGYCAYLGTNNTTDPVTAKGLLGTSPAYTGGLCPFIVTANSLDTAVAQILATPLSSSNDAYYLSLKAVDRAGNISNSSAQFQLRFDDTKPTNPSFLNAPSGFVATEEVEVTWPTGDDNAADDDHSGVVGLQYRIGSGGTWYGDTHNGSQSVSDLLADDGAYTTDHAVDAAALNEGNNNFYVRTWDAAGNVSTTYVSAVIRINTTAPSNPQNVEATPDTNTTNSFAFSWDPPASFVGSADDLTYCYSVNTEPGENTCTFTEAGVTSLDAGAYATQPGENNFYVVAKDEAGNINYDDFGQVEFTANTSAPGIPLNVDIADISVKSTENWKLTISWEEPTDVGAGVASYRLFRSTNNLSFSQVASTSGTSFVDTGLDDITYYYKIRACDSANNCGAYSATVEELPTGKFTEAANLIGEPEVSDISTRKATIEWTTDRASDSRIQFGLESGEYFPTESANSDQESMHEIQLNNLTAGTTYFYRAKWTDEDGNIGISAEQSFSTQDAPVVKEVKTPKIGLSEATVRFTSTDAHQIKIYYGRTEGFGGSSELNTSPTESTYNVTLDGLSDGTKYFFKINTFDEDGNEYEGNVFSLTTPARPRITNLRFQPVKGSPTSTQSVTWTTNVPTTSEVAYNIVGKSAQEVSVSKLTTDHKVIIRGLKDASRYELVARSRDKSGNLATSDRQEFRTALDTRAPKIFDIVVEDGIRGTGSEARGQVVVSWKTDEPATSQVEYGEGTGGSSYTTRTVEDSSLVTDHIVIVSDLPTSRTYHMRAVSRDKAFNAGYSDDHATIIGRPSESVIGIIFNALQKVFSFL